jgi:hypothetical protein
MIDHLSEILDKFPGAANQTHCFAHTLSISAKAILKQFDVPKAKDGENLDAAAQALADLAKELDVKEQSAQETHETGDDEEDDQPLDTWVDFREGLTEEQVTELDASIQPVRSMLVKVRCRSFDPNPTLTNLSNKAAQDGLRSQELHHSSPPAMVQYIDHPPPFLSYDAA